MNKFIKPLSALILFSACAFLIHASPAAAANKNPNGVTVSPAFQQVSISQGEAQHMVNFAITNNKPSAQSFSLSVADFNTLGESGGVFFVGTNPTQLQKKYGLAKWFDIGQKKVTLQPKQTLRLQANILNLPDLAPGGHYGALMITAENNDGSGPGANKVALHPIASSLLFVTKIGGDTHKLGLAAVTESHNLFKLPASVTLRFHNDGNTHLIPRGNVTIASRGGKLISKGIINPDSAIILPESFRQYYVPLAQLGSNNPPGNYILKVDFRFDGLDQFRSYQQSFKFIPLAYITGFALIALVLGLIISRDKRKLKKFWPKRRPSGSK